MCDYQYFSSLHSKSILIVVPITTMNYYFNLEKINILLILDKRNYREAAILYKQLYGNRLSEETFRNIEQYLRENEKFYDQNVV